MPKTRRFNLFAGLSIFLVVLYCTGSLHPSRAYSNGRSLYRTSTSYRGFSANGQNEEPQPQFGEPPPTDSDVPSSVPLNDASDDGPKVVDNPTEAQKKLVAAYDLNSVPEETESEDEMEEVEETEDVDEKESEAGSADNFNEAVFNFQADTKLPQPKRDLGRYAKYSGHNYALRPPGQRETVSTFFCSRNSTLADPYFSAVQSLIYRNLWSPASRSASRPFTVFVAPFVGQEQRDILAGAGAIIRELPLIPWNPTTQTFARWRDLFSKLHIWGQTEFSRIVFLDGDAFPVKPIDHIWDEAPQRRCDAPRLSPADAPFVDEMCNYTLAATGVYPTGTVNVGVMVLSTGDAIHSHLLRAFEDPDNFDDKMAEQAFLNKVFNDDKAFSWTQLGREWNGYFPQERDIGNLNIIHEKLWVAHEDWLRREWNETWAEMVEFYDSDEFVRLREADNVA